MQMIISTGGGVKCLYNETINLSSLGKMEIKRGSHVEPTPGGEWTVDLSPVDGPLLGPYRKRSDALLAEVEWIENHFLTTVRNSPPSIQEPVPLLIE